MALRKLYFIYHFIYFIICFYSFINFHFHLIFLPQAWLLLHFNHNYLHLVFIYFTLYNLIYLLHYIFFMQLRKVITAGPGLTAISWCRGLSMLSTMAFPCGSSMLSLPSFIHLTPLCVHGCLSMCLCIIVGVLVLLLNCYALCVVLKVLYKYRLIEPGLVENTDIVLSSLHSGKL